MPRKRFFADLRGIVVLPLCGDACGADCFAAAKRLMRRSPVEIVRPEAARLALPGQLPRSASGCALRATALRCSGGGRGAELAALRSAQTPDAELVNEVRCAHRPPPCAARRARCPGKASPAAPGGNGLAGEEIQVTQN